MKFLYLLLLLTLAGCGHAPWMQSITRLDNFEHKESKAICAAEVSAKHYTNNAEGTARCLKDKMLAEARRIDFGAIPIIEAGYDKHIANAREYDAGKINQDELIAKNEEVDCITQQAIGREMENTDLDYRYDDVETLIKESCSHYKNGRYVTNKERWDEMNKGSEGLQKHTPEALKPVSTEPPTQFIVK